LKIYPPKSGSNTANNKPNFYPHRRQERRDFSQAQTAGTKLYPEYREPRERPELFLNRKGEAVHLTSVWFGARRQQRLNPQLSTVLLNGWQ
jgi:hypothetical protein